MSDDEQDWDLDLDRYEEVDVGGLNVAGLYRRQPAEAGGSGPINRFALQEAIEVLQDAGIGTFTVESVQLRGYTDRAVNGDTVILRDVDDPDQFVAVAPMRPGGSDDG